MNLDERTVDAKFENKPERFSTCAGSARSIATSRARESSGTSTATSETSVSELQQVYSHKSTARGDCSLDITEKKEWNKT